MRATEIPGISRIVGLESNQKGLFFIISINMWVDWRTAIRWTGFQFWDGLGCLFGCLGRHGQSLIMARAWLIEPA